MKYILFTLLLAGTFTPNLKAEDMDPITAGIACGCAAVFGTAVATTGLMSASELREQRLESQREAERARIAARGPFPETAFELRPSNTFGTNDWDN